MNKISTPPRPGSRREKLWEFVKRCRNGFAWHEAKDAYDEGYPLNAGQLFGNPRRHSSLEVGRLLKEWAVRTSRGWYKMKPELVEQFELDVVLNPPPAEPPPADHIDLNAETDLWKARYYDLVFRVDSWVEAVDHTNFLVTKLSETTLNQLHDAVMDIEAQLAGLATIMQESKDEA